MTATKKMRISVIIPSFYPAVVYGGTIFASLNYARLLASSGHEVWVSTTNTNKTARLKVPVNQFLEMEENIRVKYYRETVVDKFSLSLYFNIHKDIRSADVVHIQSIFNTPVPLALYHCRRNRKPVLLSPHGVLGEWIMNHGSSFKNLWLKTFIKPFASYVHWHATSGQEAREILHHFPDARIHIVPNPVDLKMYEQVSELSRSGFLQRFGKTSGTPDRIVVSMGRLQKKKGFDILIRAFGEIKKKYPSACLFIAGQDEGEEANLRQLIGDLQLDRAVILTGSLEGRDKVDFLGNADLFVLPSHNENFGIVYAEALAAGTPVIAAKDTPWEEVEQFRCGRWVMNTVEENVSAMLEMLETDRTEARNNARNYVRKYSMENVREELNKIFNLAANGNA